MLYGAAYDLGPLLDSFAAMHNLAKTAATDQTCLQGATSLTLEPLVTQLDHLLDSTVQGIIHGLPSEADGLLLGSSITFVCVLVMQVLPYLHTVARAAKGSKVAKQHSDVLQQTHVALSRTATALAAATRLALKVSQKVRAGDAIHASGLERLLGDHPTLRTVVANVVSSQYAALERLLPFLK